MRRLLALIFVAGLAAAAWYGWSLYRAPFRGYGAAEQFVDITPGSSTRAIGGALVQAGIVRDRIVFRIALWRLDAARRLKAGEYRFDRPMTVDEVVDTLTRGAVYLRAITIPEGLTIGEMSRVYERAGLGDAKEFVSAASDPALIGDLDGAARDLEGYLFPETYSLSRHASADVLIAAMVKRLREVFSEGLRAEAARRGLSVRDVITLASIVEKETAQPPERPLVAAVYLRRLAIGMALQSDPTVIYGLQRIGRYDGNLTRAGLELNTPYNTYRRPGLPPGPIAAPSRSSIEAVVRPAQTDYLYFVSRNDRSHVFARTLTEHSRNVQRFQVQYFRNGPGRTPATRLKERGRD